MKISKAFDCTLKDFSISAKWLSKQSGIAPQSISEFRREKKTIQTDSLEKLLDALPIEAKVHFFSLLLGSGVLVEKLVASMDYDEISDMMMAIANKLKTNREKKHDSNHGSEDSIKKALLFS